MIEAALAFLSGTLIGSFLNVCIHRWPRDLSVVWPGSHCVTCGHGIAWYDNIPLLSYVVLHGRCRHCLAPVAWRYPVVELLTGLAFAVCAWRWGISPLAAKFMLFAAMNVGMIFADYETRLLPDEFTKGGIWIGLGLAVLIPFEAGAAPVVAEVLRWWSLPAAQTVAAGIAGPLVFFGALGLVFRSRCKECLRQVRWYDNIPLLSRILLHGRCRYCRAAINWSELPFEAMAAMGVALSSMWLFGPPGVGMQPFSGVELPKWALSLLESALGAGIASLALWMTGWLMTRIKKKEMLGFGDVKMVGMMGAFLGLGQAMVAIALGNFMGLVLGGGWMLWRGKDTSSYYLPLGSFLGIAAIGVALL